MRSRTRTIAAAAIAAAALAAGSGAAVASATGAKPGAPGKTMSASQKPSGAKAAGERQGHGAMTAAVARELHVSTARVGAALRPLFAADHADPSSPMFVAAARSLGVSPQQLSDALVHAKQSLAAAMHVNRGQVRSKAAGSKAAGAAQERQNREAMTAAVARELHVSTARAGAALGPLFAAGHADPSSPMFVAAARSLGVGTQQLLTALMHAKQSLAGGQ